MIFDGNSCCRSGGGGGWHDKFFPLFNSTRVTGVGEGQSNREIVAGREYTSPKRSNVFVVCGCSFR